ncbi:MAG: serine hydrolase domain-containing protein [Bacteroidota bacterium]|nr:serine hydrolase domain-containing protein [Bacteroidota bacterium]
MKSIYLFLLTIILGCAQTYENSILQFQNELITSEKTGSNVAMVFKDGEVVYNETVNSNKEGDKEINEETIFPIFSMSKPITIVAMMTLYEKGLINFDENVSKYIPEFSELQCKNENGDVYSCENDLKILHLMTHRSGYTYYGNPLNFTSTIKYDNLDDFVTDVSKHPVEFEPGSSYLYGINQAILGKVVEVVTGMSFYEYLKETIFDPLGMNETKFYLTPEDRERFQPLFINSGSLKGFTNFLDEMTYDVNNRAYFGGEGLVSTMRDYSKFCQMLLNNGELNGNKIIDRSSIDLMVEKHSDLESDPFLNINEGFHLGFSVFVLNDPEKDGTNSSEGIYGWSGYHNTHFWIDNEKNLFGLFMTRAREFSFGIQGDFRKAVYENF